MMLAAVVLTCLQLQVLWYIIIGWLVLIISLIWISKCIIAGFTLFWKDTVAGEG